MLGNLVFNHLAKQLRIQYTVRAPVDSSLHTGHQLRNLSAREAINLARSVPEEIDLEMGRVFRRWERLTRGSQTGMRRRRSNAAVVCLNPRHGSNETNGCFVLR